MASNGIPRATWKIGFSAASSRSWSCLHASEHVASCNVVLSPLSMTIFVLRMQGWDLTEMCTKKSLGYFQKILSGWDVKRELLKRGQAAVCSRGGKGRVHLWESGTVGEVPLKFGNIQPGLRLSHYLGQYGDDWPAIKATHSLPGESSCRDSPAWAIAIREGRLLMKLPDQHLPLLKASRFLINNETRKWMLYRRRNPLTSSSFAFRACDDGYAATQPWPSVVHDMLTFKLAFCGEYELETDGRPVLVRSWTRMKVSKKHRLRKR